MADSNFAKPGQHPTPDQLVNVPRLITAFYSLHPDANVRAQRVSFGTSGHRGSALHLSFNEDHIAAITQAICDYRKSESINGPLFLAKDTHALSEPAFTTAVEVLAANDVDAVADEQVGCTATPVAYHTIFDYNRAR